MQDHIAKSYKLIEKICFWSLFNLLSYAELLPGNNQNLRLLRNASIHVLGTH